MILIDGTTSIIRRLSIGIERVRAGSVVSGRVRSATWTSRLLIVTRSVSRQIVGQVAATRFRRFVD